MISQRCVTAAKRVTLSHENVRDYRSASPKLQRSGLITGLVYSHGRAWPRIRWAGRTFDLGRHQAFPFCSHLGSRSEMG